MRKIILTLTLTIISVCSFAQQDSLKPQKGDWGFSLNITGLINDIKVENNQDPNGNYFIFGRHYISNDKAVRFGVGLNYLNQKWFNSDSINIVTSGNRALQEVDSTISRFDFTLSLGIEKHLGTARRLDPYVGGELLVGRLGNTKTNAKTDITDVTGTAKLQRIIQVDGGFFFGLGGVAGFNYFFSKNISLGAEFGYALAYVKGGGDFSESLVETPVSGAQKSDFTKGKAEVSQTNIGATPTGGILLSFFF